MAVKIRLKRMGSKKIPFFRVVAADSRSPRDGRFIETLGYYDPMKDPPEIKFDDDKVYKWLDNGAIPTENAKQLLRKAGLLERWRLLKQGVPIHELDAKIEELRAKQPKPLSPEEKKARKEARKKAKEESEKAAEEVEEKKEEAEGTPEETAGGKAEEGSSEEPAEGEEK